MPNHYGTANNRNRGNRNATAGGNRLNNQNNIGPSPGGNQQTYSTVDLGIGSILPAGHPLTTQTKVTKGYFTGDTGLLTGNLIHTGSLSDSNENYYFTITNNHPDSSSVATQFAATFGHRGGSGSNQIDGSGNETLIGETRAIYNQFATLVLPEGEISGGFKISAAGSAGVHYADQTPDEYIYVLVAQRARFKDELDYGNWTLQFKGQDSDGNDLRGLYLTDDSKETTTSAKNSIYGRRFSIVSGSVGATSGTVEPASAHRTFGWYYPEAGFMIFSGAELSASIPGQNTSINMTASFGTTFSGEGQTHLTHSGFAPNLDNTANCNNALRLVNCLRGANTEEQRFRSAQIQNKKSYFLTVPPESCNFSTNGTFVSGSQGKLRHKSMYGNPNVFITTVGLHRSDGVLIAVAKLSTPVIKNFGVQTTIKVNLTY